jgi:hypothetical protein
MNDCLNSSVDVKPLHEMLEDIVIWTRQVLQVVRILQGRSTQRVGVSGHHPKIDYISKVSPLVLDWVKVEAQQGG